MAMPALWSWLVDHHYSLHAVERIVAHTLAEGTPTGAPELDREDEELATEVWIEAMPRVPMAARDWDGRIPAGIVFVTDAEAEAPLCEAWDRLHEEEMRRLDEGRPAAEAPAWEPSDDDIAWLNECPPVCGGGPMEALGETIVEEMRDWYDRNPLSRFNEERTDR
jgi:hypothetical protein